MRSSTATLIGLVALVLWSALAALTVATGAIPAFQLLAMTFTIGALAGMAAWGLGRRVVPAVVVLGAAAYGARYLQRRLGNAD